MQNEKQKLPAALYLVATPIGNLEDFSPRAISTLKQADLILAEDTRESQKLLHAFQISGRLESFHKDSGPQKAEKIIEQIAAGSSIAYISDAGTPGLSDPGAELAYLCHERHLPVVPIPGASALTALWSASGVKAKSFHFHGFFPREKGERVALLEQWQEAGGAQAFFESKHRIFECLKALAEKFPQASLVVGRELTKKFESIHRGTCASLLDLLQKEAEFRGEFCLILELPEKDLKEQNGSQVSRDQVEALAKDLAELGASQKILVRVLQEFGWSKNEAYDKALSLRQK